LGSAFAGAKAGILAGVVYCAIIGVYNLALLYIFKPSVLNALSQIQECSGAATNSTLTPEQCFPTLTVVLLPETLLVVFIFSLVFSVSFGLLYDSLPGKNPSTKAATISMVLFLILLFSGRTGVYFNYASFLVLVLFNVVLLVLYSLMLGGLYKRYTRAVQFSSDAPEEVRILVDGRDVTNTTRTYSASSSHSIRAETPGTAAFKEWATSGGVSVEDEKSFETSMKVSGDGLLKAGSARKIT
jgi:hypothetical protein